MDMKSKVTNSILMDDLKGAELLIAKNPKRFEMLSKLLKKVKKNPLPLKTLTSQPPRTIIINTSYTCGLGCEMCSTGFKDKFFLYDDYKYYLPEQFDKLSPWINSASDITFVGVGETLNSPYINYFLSKTTEKHSTIGTNGIPLNKKKIQSFIDAKLNILSLSFDGKLSLGHGKGDDRYIQSFWKKVQLIQKTKKIFNSTLPVIKLTITVASENMDNLDEIIETAYMHGINDITLNPMYPFSEKVFHKSIFIDFDKSKKRINSTLSKWNKKKGVLVTTVAGLKKLQNSLNVCFFIDNWLHFHGRNNIVTFCCGSLEMPVYFSDVSQIDYWNSFPLRYFRYLHFCSNRNELPNACKNCWAINLKEYSQKCASSFNGSKNKKGVASDHITLYNSASKLKQNNLNSRAEKLFLEVLKLKTDPELKGKVYFHLGEIQLRRKDYKQALRLMKLTVQYCFNHARAFAYLSLLMMLLGEKKIKKRRKKFKVLFTE